MIKFRVLGKPIGKARARFVCVGGRPRAYPDTVTAQYGALVALETQRAFRGVVKPLSGPVEVEITAVMRRPKARMRKKDPDVRERHTKKPDADNIAKVIQDGVVKSGVLDDDACVWRVTCEKWMADKSEAPHADITIRWGNPTLAASNRE